MGVIAQLSLFMAAIFVSNENGPKECSGVILRIKKSEVFIFGPSFQLADKPDNQDAPLSFMRIDLFVLLRLLQHKIQRLFQAMKLIRW